jgi:hypothetical protein
VNRRMFVVLQMETITEFVAIALVAVQTSTRASTGTSLDNLWEASS